MNIYGTPVSVRATCLTSYTPSLVKKSCLLCGHSLPLLQLFNICDHCCTKPLCFDIGSGNVDSLVVMCGMLILNVVKIVRM